ncbi:MAG TPA: selenocysteine-specific translation elongation factor [Acidimicrobiales bacterium]|nr:selenocysteine-specific translation elongation factor [Acidimicrobiales bacterium]
MHVVATAGHVDHGKSTLVLALTGMDPDRFAEEKARGLTIDLGFAWTTLPSGAGVALVDVPGHVRFIKNMLAGVGAVDACLFVVAATEGWKPQSEEHLRILELLGVTHGLVVLTKVGLVDEDWEAIARLEVAEHLAGTFLAGAEVVAVDAPTGRGLDELRAGLDRLLAATPTAADRGRPRLWVDRAFAARGSGTVVTGTLAGGRLATDDEVVLVPGGPRHPVRIRALQSHQRAVPELGPGHRCALNLVGVHHGSVSRGQALVRADQWAPTRTFDASLTVLAGLGHDLSRRGSYHAYLGSGEHAVRIRLLDRAALGPGTTGLVRIHLPVPLPLLPGDRYVLRESGRSETVGGGEVLDVDPVLPAARARPDRSVERVVAERGWVEADLLERLTGQRRPPDVGGRWVVDPAALAEARRRLSEAVASASDAGLPVALLSERDRALLDGLEGVEVRDGVARPAGHRSDEALAGHPWLDGLEASPFQPPPPDGVDRAQVRALVRAGLVVECDGVHFAAGAVQEAIARIAGLLRLAPEGVTVGAVRDELGTSRKFLLPLLGYLDANGFTRRRGDLRIAGPRLPVGPGA